MIFCQKVNEEKWSKVEVSAYETIKSIIDYYNQKVDEPLMLFVCDAIDNNLLKNPCFPPCVYAFNFLTMEFTFSFSFPFARIYEISE